MPSQGTPTVNGLYNDVTASGQPTGPLLTSNPNLSNPARLGRGDPMTCDQDHGSNYAVMGYYDGNTVTALWNLAQKYAMSDNSYTTNFGPSTPGAFNVTSAQTYGVICGPSSATINDPKCAAPTGLDTTTVANSDITVPATQDPGPGTNFSDADPTYDICTYLPSANGGDGRSAASS